jgi:hypothetical protein
LTVIVGAILGTLLAQLPEFRPSTPELFLAGFLMFIILTAIFLSMAFLINGVVADRGRPVVVSGSALLLLLGCLVWDYGSSVMVGGVGSLSSAEVMSAFTKILFVISVAGWMITDKVIAKFQA